MIVGGFAEGLFFRGYVQSGLNEVFTRGYNSLLGFRCIWHQGTLITATSTSACPHTDGHQPIYGKVRGKPENPLDDSVRLLPQADLRCHAGETENIILPTVAHFSVTYSTLSLFPAIAGGFAAIIAPMVALFAFFLKPFQDFLDEEF